MQDTFLLKALGTDFYLKKAILNCNRRKMSHLIVNSEYV